MDLLTRADLDLLAGPDEPGTHLSLFLPTHRLGSEDRTDPLRWKNLLTSTESALSDQGMRRGDIEQLLGPAWVLHADDLAWQYMSDGLVMFLRPGWYRSYRVPIALPELATVGQRFVTGPLLRVVSRDSHFLLLALSQRNVRLLEGSMQRVEELELRDVPTDLRDIIEEPEPRSDTMTRLVSAGGRGGRAVFYGHGAADEDFKKEEVHKFLRQVADGLGEYLSGQDLPMVLVGLGEMVAAYRSVNSYPHVLDEEIRTNPDGMPPEKLHEAAWPVIEGVLDAQRSRALERFGELHGTGRASDDPDQIAEAAIQGRVETLFVAAEPWCWEQMSNRGAIVQLGADESFARCELLDRAITDTLSHGGQVHAIPAAEVPGGRDVAASFRY
jgi:hypothetical protein